MQTHLSESAGVWDSDSGAFISAKMQRMAEVLSDYNSNFSLVWIPPKNRDATDVKPYAILDSTPGIPQYIMRYLSEVEMSDPAAVLAWIFDGDLSKHRPVDIITRIENRENAERLLELRKEVDAAEDRQSHVAFYASGGRDGLNYIREHGKTLAR
jgi:hypothetical protein